MRRPHLIRPLALAALLALVLSGCVPTATPPDAAPIDPDAQALVQELRSLPFDQSKVDLVAGALDAAGVAVADTWDPDATAVVRITPWQMQNMAAEAANDGGVSGAELEAISPAPAGAPPLGYLISAWAIDFDSDGARLAHALLGDQDFHHPEVILFPSLVTTLFLADATADYDASDYQAAAAGIGTASVVGFPDARAAGVCSAVGNFIQRAIATVVNALKVDTSGGGFFGFLGKIWNAAVDLATGFVKGLIEAVTRPIVQIMVTIFGAIETIRQLSTYLVEWRSTLVPNPETNMFGIDDAKVHGRVTLTVLDNRIPIPEAVLECSDLFGVNLRDAGTAAGSHVSWTPTNMARPDLSRLDAAEDVLDRNQIAQYDYFTGQESAKEAKGDEHAGLLKLVSSVHRNDIEKVRKLFTALVFDQIPSSIRGIVQSIAGPILDAATNHLTSITDVRSTGYVAITFHGEKPPEPSPAESNAAKSWQGQWQSSKYDESGTFTLLIVIADGKLNGSIDIANSPCVSSGEVAGVASAGSVTFGSVEAGNEIQYQGTISADGATMQGTYSDGAACGNDAGTWSARLTK
ncbi:MAG TPA: hypothetical protein VGO65_12635 [Pseudolysinimonas sp.]|nr:hypothetical protein [Pseudolysinimonas sp.]